MNRHNLIVWMFAIILLALPASADIYTEFTIITPERTHLTQSSPYQINAELFNSTVHHQNNTNIDCYFYIFDNAGLPAIRNATMTKRWTTNHHYNITGSTLSQLGEYPYVIYCLEQNSSNSGIYQDTFTITKTGRALGTDSSAAIAATIFILAITALLFIIPFLKIRFSKTELTNLLIKRSFIVIALYLMTLNSAMMATIVENAGITLEREMFRYMWLFGTAGWLMIGIVAFRTLLDALKLSKENATRKVME